MRHRILITVLTIVYGAVALPGHSGLHWLSGIEHCEHTTSQSTASAPASTKSCCEHSSHSHPHSHNHPQDDANENGSRDSPHQNHQHDSDCEICQWLSQGQISITSTSVDASESTFEESLPTPVDPVEEPTFSVADPRGPPVA